MKIAPEKFKLNFNHQKKSKIGKTTRCTVDWVLLTLLLVAFVVRILWIGDFFGQDEVYYVGYAHDLITGRPFNSVFPPGFYYFLAPFELVFGDSELPMHIFMVILGTLNVALVYLIGKKFINRWVGAVAALLLTFNTTHWFFSDFAMLDMPVTLFITLAIYFYWNGYQTKNYMHLLLAALVCSLAALTKYGFFPAVAMGAYLLFFDRKWLRDRRMLVALALPLIVFGIYMLHYIFVTSWLWNWWSNYIVGGLSINLPWFYYFMWTYEEFLLAIPTLFVLIAAGFLLVKKFVAKKSKFVKYENVASYMVLAVAAAVIYIIIFSRMIGTSPYERAIIGLAALALLCANYFFKNDNKFNKLAIFFVVIMLGFYSVLGLKFARYVLPVLPFVYLLVAQVVYDIRKNKLWLAAAAVVIILFIVLNASDTITKLQTDNMINHVKHAAQQYVIDNSKQCSEVYSSTWYSFYYLRTRIADQPSVSAIKNAVSSRCSCPPKFILSEGGLTGYDEVLVREKEFKDSIKVWKFDLDGVREHSIATTVVVVYKIKDSVVVEQCGKV